MALLAPPRRACFHVPVAGRAVSRGGHHVTASVNEAATAEVAFVTDEHARWPWRAHSSVDAVDRARVVEAPASERLARRRLVHTRHAEEVEWYRDELVSRLRVPTHQPSIL